VVVGGAVSVGLGLVAVQPSLLALALLGAGVGLVTGLIAALRENLLKPQAETEREPARKRAPSQPSGWARSLPIRGPVVTALGILLAVSLVIFLGARDEALFVTQPPHPELPSLTNPRLEPAQRPVRAIDYEGVFAYSEDEQAWRTLEIAHIARERLRRLSTAPAVSDNAPAASFGDRAAIAPRLGSALGSDWIDAGGRGRGGRTLLFRRERTIPVDLPDLWPPVDEDTVPIGTIAPPALPIRFVPRDGSLVEIRSPDNFIRGIDADAERRSFGDEVIYTVELDGLEDIGERRLLRLRIADGIGRWSIYQALESISAWAIVQVLFAGLPALIVAYFVTEGLKRRSGSGADKVTQAR
jgi:hypothetical protein